jgi:RNA ligase (TIGR02306 family)
MSSLIIEVCRIDDIKKHPNADRLSICVVKGWNCIVGLDQYKIGDLVVFCPPDSVIPSNLIDKYKLEYLRSNGRVGTTKLRGFISQGLILDLPDGNWKLGDNVADYLGITKYQVPEPPIMRGIKLPSKKKLNPLFDKYTDIENIKNFNDVFEDNDLVVITEKIHGSNARYSNLEIVIDKSQPFLYKAKNWFAKTILGHTHQFVYGSHNVQITGNSERKSFYGDDIWGKIAEKYDLVNKIPKDYIVYGEIYGKGIQDLTYGLNDVDLVIFDIKVKDKYLNWDAVVDFCQENDLKHVPVLYIGGYFADMLRNCTNGPSLLCPKQMREGCVVKMFEDCNHLKIGRKILKSVSSEYLTRKNATEYQ